MLFLMRGFNEVYSLYNLQIKSELERAAPRTKVHGLQQKKLWVNKTSSKKIVPRS